MFTARTHVDWVAVGEGDPVGVGVSWIGAFAFGVLRATLLDAERG
jgi:hypothetical protein